MFTAIALVCVLDATPRPDQCAVSINTEYFYGSAVECELEISRLSAEGAFKALIAGEKTYLAEYVCLEWFGSI